MSHLNMQQKLYQAYKLVFFIYQTYTSNWYSTAPFCTFSFFKLKFDSVLSLLQNQCLNNDQEIGSTRSLTFSSRYPKLPRQLKQHFP